MSADHIAFVCPRFRGEGKAGGAETLLRCLAERLAAHGRRVTFLATCATDHVTWANDLAPGHKRVREIDVHLFPVDTDRNVDTFLAAQDRICRGGHAGPQDETDWISNSVRSAELDAFIVEHKDEWDAILAGPYLYGTTYRAAQIAPAKTLLVPCLHDEPFAHLGIMRDMFRDVAGHLFNCEPEMELAGRLYDLPPENGRVVGMGLDPFNADGDAFRARHRLDQPYVLYCGRREEGKGVFLLLDYVRTLRRRTDRDVRLVLTGSGAVPYKDGDENIIVDVGFVSEQEKWDAMAGALAFVHASVFESLGIVLLEAFLAGTPALVHANGAVLRWQCERSNAGLWFRSYPDFEEAVLWLLSHPEQAAAMGAAGRSYVEREYAWPRIEEKLLAACDDLLPG